MIVATPDHWHAIITVAACNAGKDVYCEKPLTLMIGEGRKMVEAARRNSRVVQAGSQQRSGAHYIRAVELIKSRRYWTGTSHPGRLPDETSIQD